MIDNGKHNLLGVLIDGVDYAAAVQRIIRAAEAGRGYAVTALAVHGLMTAVQSRQHRYRVNRMDLVTPDGQAVRWALNLTYAAGLPDRVYGPRLTLEVCAAARLRGLPVYFYGSRREVLDRLAERLVEANPGLVIAGTEPSKFRRTTLAEKREATRRIRASGAKITFVGLGCPRQEVFAYEYRDALSMPVIAVGAAFDYLAGTVREPPPAVQRAGLQWLYRLVQEPRRLWRRYCLLNPAFIALWALQVAGLWRPDPQAVEPPAGELLFG